MIYSRPDQQRPTVGPYQTAAMMNSATYSDLFIRLKGLATTVYEWTGFPEFINLRFLERVLFEYGKAVYHVDPNLGPMISKVTEAGGLNYYDEPTRLHAYGTGGYSRYLKPDDCVIIRNNPMMEPTLTTIQLFATRLYEIERSIDVNVRQQKFPLIVSVTPQQELTLRNLYKQYSGNEPVIVVDRMLEAEKALKAVNTDAPFVADKLTTLKHDVWNECMSFLGINNANTDKRERLITDEVQANDQLIQVAAEVMLATRREAAAAISKRFNVPVSVSVKQFETSSTIESPDRSEAGADTEGGAD